jgi:hypothetical protein
VVLLRTCHSGGGCRLSCDNHGAGGGCRHLGVTCIRWRLTVSVLWRIALLRRIPLLRRILLLRALL